MYIAAIFKRLAVMTVAVPAALVAACATTPAPSSTSAPQSLSAEVSHPDTKAE